MMKNVILLVIILITSQITQAQTSTLRPEQHITTWYGLEEWIAAAMNLGYESMDLSSFDFQHYGYSNSLIDQTNVQINGLPFNASWLSNDILTLPDFRLTTVDSILYDNSSNEFDHAIHNGNTIKIFLKPSIISNQVTRINQVDDPGLHSSSDLITPNVESIRKSISNYAAFPIASAQVTLFNSIINRSKSGRIHYDRKRINRKYHDRRTTVENANGRDFFARNRKGNVFSFVENESSTLKWSLLANYFYSTQYYDWYALSGIEIPFSLEQYQLSSSIRPKSDGPYEQSTIHFSMGISDTLELSVPDVYHRLEEIKMIHSSRFKFGGVNPLKVGIQNSYYDITDRTSNKSINHLESTVYLEKHFSTGFELTSSIGNSKQVFEIAYSNSTPIAIRFSQTQENPFKLRYSMNMWRSGIGFTNLNQDNHSINFDSNSKLRVSELRIFGSHERQKQKINWFIYAKHYWTLVNETYEYQSVNDRAQLNSIVNYFDSDNVGLAGGRVEHVWQPDAKLTIRSMLSSNIALYAENAVNSYFERVPSFILAEQIQYRIHDNFIMEVFYRYIPERSIEEYSSILFNGFPFTRIRPISMLNYSTTIWTFNRRLETSLTLRNLLNSTESYDTYGIYYNMSINVSAKINFKTN